jgi:hypothetical protein
MNIDELKIEIDTDPLARGYSGMSNQEVADDMNIINRTTPKSTLTGSEVLNAVNKTEFDSKTDAQKQMVWDIVHLGSINPYGIEAAMFQDIFGASTTITSLQELRLNNVGRGVELGLGIIGEGDVWDARNN